VLEHELAGARTRLREIVILHMKTWLPEETLNGLQWAEAFRREQVRVYRVLERKRENEGPRRTEGHFTV